MDARRMGWVAAGTAILGLATAWGLMVSVVASGPASKQVALPNNGFAQQQGTSETVLRAKYGGGIGEFGITFGGETRGPQSFGVDDRERVYVLDAVNRRVVRFAQGVPDAEFLLPDDRFEDLAVARDVVCALSRVEDRRVVVFDAASGSASTLSIAESVPPIFRLFIVGGDVVVECPGRSGRSYHTVGTTSGKAAPPSLQAQKRNGGTPLPNGDALTLTLQSRNDLALDVTRDDGTSGTRLRAHSERDIAAILDATSDRLGNVFITWALASDDASEAPDPQDRLVVTRHSVTGELTGRVETANGSDPEPFRKTVVSESGALYQLVTDRAGVRVLRWTMAR